MAVHLDLNGRLFVCREKAELLADSIVRQKLGGDMKEPDEPNPQMPESAVGHIRCDFATVSLWLSATQLSLEGTFSLWKTSPCVAYRLNWCCIGRT